MRFRPTLCIAALALAGVLCPQQVRAEPSACENICKAVKKECPETCKESGSKQEQEQCLKGCPAEVADCEKHCPAMESRARSRKLGEPSADLVRLPHSDDSEADREPANTPPPEPPSRSDASESGE